jgi:hypothetical protein
LPLDKSYIVCGWSTPAWLFLSELRDLPGIIV